MHYASIVDKHINRHFFHVDVIWNGKKIIEVGNMVIDQFLNPIIQISWKVKFVIHAHMLDFYFTFVATFKFWSSFQSIRKTKIRLTLKDLERMD